MVPEKNFSSEYKTKILLIYTINKRPKILCLPIAIIAPYDSTPFPITLISICASKIIL